MVAVRYPLYQEGRASCRYGGLPGVCYYKLTMKRLAYNPKLKQFAKDLRKNGTYAEVVLWLHLKKKQMHGYDFHRQKPIGNYIVDFYSPKLMLAIEIDGYSHIDKGEEDEQRQQELEKLGVSFLRFKEYEVKKNLEGVLMAIEKWIFEN